MDFASNLTAIQNALPLAALKFTTRELFLLIGSGLLAVGLLTLALTRWGQAKPIWKCVVLSVMAHILLMAYAYSTQMIRQVPQATAVTDDAVKITLLDEAGGPFGADVGLVAAETSESAKPWMKFVSHQQHLPTVDELERPMVDSELELVTTQPQQMPIQSPPRTQLPGPEMAEMADPFDEQSQPAAFQPGQPEITTEVPIPAPVQPQRIQRPEIAAPIEFAPSFDNNPVQEPPRVDVDPLSDPFESTTNESNPAFVSDLVANDSSSAASQPLPSRHAPAAMSNSLPNRGQFRVTKNPRRLGDGKAIPKMYSLRNQENRSSVLQKRGGNAQTEAAVEAALKWLSESQSNDGSWDPAATGGGRENHALGQDRRGAGAQADSGITSLAILSFLASGHSHLEGPHRKTVQQGLEYLIANQQTNGCLAGQATLYAKMYCHSMTLLALSEALALTGDSRLIHAVQRGVDYSVKAQNSSDGSWRYQPGDTGDMSQFGWQVLALHSAELGGVHVPQRTKDRMEKFLGRATSGKSNGLASYRIGEGPSATMTAEALVCRYFLNGKVGQLTTEEAADYLSREMPSSDHVNFYYWYYGTMAMYHAGGEQWENWNQRLQKTLLSSQTKQGTDAGSWQPNGIWSSYGGRVYSTSMAALSLQVYYRYLPIYEVADGRQNGTEMNWR